MRNKTIYDTTVNQLKIIINSNMIISRGFYNGLLIVLTINSYIYLNIIR